MTTSQSAPPSASPTKPKRLYREVADQIATHIADGTYKTGARLPGERELATNFGVSRATIREAMIALEIVKLVEIRTGAGIFVIAHNDGRIGLIAEGDIGPGPFELTEARALFEGEAAALAAIRISEDELNELEHACREMSELVAQGKSTEEVEERFHLTVAQATRNSAILNTIDRMWVVRTAMPLWQKLHQLIGELQDEPGWTSDMHTVMDHRRILTALRARDADAARAAMRLHLDHIKENLLRASEIDGFDLVPTRMTK